MKSSYKWLLPVVILTLATSCKEFISGINDDPNNPTESSIDIVLNAAFTGLIIGHEGEDARLACMWSGQFSGSDRQYSGYQIYNTNSGNFNWHKYYIVAENAGIVLREAEATNNQLAAGIARILQAHAYGMTASIWGDIPFSEANRFLEFSDPKFDPQKEVYAGVQQLLDKAIENLGGNPKNAAIAAKDFYFSGNAAQWRQVAYTLKARFYMHTREYAQALAAASKGVSKAADDWMIPHPGGNYNLDMNIYYSFGKIDREGYMTAENAFLPSIMDAQSGQYRGNAKTNEAARFQYLFTGTAPKYDLNYNGMWARNATFPLITVLENRLNQAEAAWRTGDKSGALDYLNQARAILAAQFPDGRYEAYLFSDFETGGMAAVSGKTADEALLMEIVEEKYCSLAGQMEVFNDLRRTANLLGVPPATGNRIPARFLIPQTEIDANQNTPNPIPDLYEPTAINK